MSTTATSLLWSSCLMIISSPTLFYHIYAKKPSFRWTFSAGCGGIP
jgi:hypothetical protein